ncbi:hypothetical protein GSI_14944 [Ganoderma sinense ZZ0214-1]|uniref:Uncharacterized protein n=1 Tax=Ganoderma sinense ZZ0214-1 TaxID=1077348 RepID=A0A2G8RQ60_9APHY|nr:hypothetical protein GSI_14944 [Ganoderma sinense ZZ0214-1]
MAPRSSKKKSKYTYAERVLGALSDIQKEQRKHAVHMATLRAHVRKMADARKDRMGPQWSQWVTRTVQRLADNGVLETSDAQVTFTPNAKKTISTIRRDSLGPGVVASTNVEHKIWKDVTRRLSTIGLKRQRRKSSEVDVAEDDDEGRPRKRRARKSFSGLTKAELEAELRAALQRLEEAEEAEPVDEDTAAALRDELNVREHEVAELRDEILRLKVQRPHEESVSGTQARLPTPPPTRPSDVSTARTCRPAAASRVAAHIHRVTRTASGTLISNFTRHPTPEPSDAGSHDADIEDMTFDHIQDTLSMANGMEDDIFANSQRRPDAIDASQSSPDLMDDVFERRMGPETSKKHLEEITTLKKELGAHVTELSRLRNGRERIVEECESLRANVASQEDQIVQLQAELESRSRVLVERESRLGELGEALATETAACREAQVALHTSQEAIQTEQERYLALESTKSSLQEELSSTRDALVTLEHEMASSESTRDLARTELEQTRTLLASTQHELVETTRTLEASTTSQAALFARTKGLEGDLEQSHAQVSALTAAKNDLETTVTTLQSTVAQLRIELAQAEDRATNASAEAQQFREVMKDLRASHAQIQSDADASAREATALNATISELEHTLGDVRSQLDDAAADTARLREDLKVEHSAREGVMAELAATQAARNALVSEVSNMTIELSTVSGELKQARETIDGMHGEIEALKKAREEDASTHAAEVSKLRTMLHTVQVDSADLRAQIDRLRSETSALSVSLDSATAEKQKLSATLADEKARSAGLEEDLAVARDDLWDAEEEITELRAAKSVDEASIQTLKAGLARLRQLQMDALDEVDSKMTSAHTAPTPGHRRRSSIAPRARESVGQHP